MCLIEWNEKRVVTARRCWVFASRKVFWMHAHLLDIIIFAAFPSALVVVCSWRKRACQSSLILLYTVNNCMISRSRPSELSSALRWAAAAARSSRMYMTRIMMSAKIWIGHAMMRWVRRNKHQEWWLQIYKQASVWAFFFIIYILLRFNWLRMCGARYCLTSLGIMRLGFILLVALALVHCVVQRDRSAPSRCTQYKFAWHLQNAWLSACAPGFVSIQVQPHRCKQQQYTYAQITNILNNNAKQQANAHAQHALKQICDIQQLLLLLLSTNWRNDDDDRMLLRIVHFDFLRPARSDQMVFFLTLLTPCEKHTHNQLVGQLRNWDMELFATNTNHHRQ